MNLLTKIGLAGALLCAAGPATAQRLVLTPEICRRMALEHNVGAKNADNDVAAAGQARKAAFTNYFPTVSASGMGFNANRATGRMALAPGMDMSLLKDGVVAGVTAVQPVFAGGQVVNGNRLARVGDDVSRLRREQARNTVELTAEQYFWQVVTLEEQLRTVVTVDSMLQLLGRDVEASVKAGIATRNDLLQVELRRNEMAATRLTLENGIDLSRQLLAQYVGADTAAIDIVAGISTDSMPAAPTALFVAPADALPLMPEYRLLEKNVEAERLQQKLTLGKQLPTVGVGAGYTYHNLLDNDRSFGMVFASVSIPISGWWGGSHEVKKQKLRVANARNDFEDGRERLAIGLTKSWNDVTEAYEQVAIARRAIGQATENLRLYNDYYKAGTATMTDLLNAQSLYSRSRDRYVTALSAYRVKTRAYVLRTGRGAAGL